MAQGSNKLMSIDCTPIWRSIVRSPGLKAFFNILSVVLSSVFASALVTEITVDGHIVWLLFYKAVSFYILFLICILIFVYNRILYLFETNVLKFMDVNYCNAYMRSKYIPEYADYCTLKIRSGQIEDFKKATEDLKELLQ